MLIDNHSHLQHEKYDAIREKVIDEIPKKMKYVVVSGANHWWNKRAIEMFKDKEGYFITLGIHPVDSVKISEKEFEEAIEFIKENAKKIRNVIGIGEIGMDYHWVKDAEKIKLMRERFIMQITIADEVKLPIITHSWDADLDVIEIAYEHKKDLKVVMHCFSEHKIVEKVHEYGFLAGICTNIVRNKKVVKSVKKLNIENILTESDAPYLSPIPNEINYPWNVDVVLKKISEIKSLSLEEVSNQIYYNFTSFYGIK